MTKLKWIVVPLSAILMVACGGGGGDSGSAPFQGSGSGSSVFGAGSGASGSGVTGDGPRPAADPTAVVSTAAIQGEVFNATSGAAISGATVAFGTGSVTSDATGFFSQASYPATSRLVQKGSITGFEDIFVPTTVLTGIPSVSVLKLTPEGSSNSLTGTTGGTVSASTGTGRVTFAANSLVDFAGVVSTTAVSIRFTSLDVGVDPYLLSGDYTSSKDEPLEAFGSVVLSNAAVVLRD